MIMGLPLRIIKTNDSLSYTNLETVFCDFSEAEKFSVQVYWKLFPIPLGAE